MSNLLYKEFRLAINPFFYVMPVLLGALMFIPQWIFFFVPLYFCFITAPNLFGVLKSNNDVSYSVMLPVSKREIVLARIASIVTLELLHIVMAVVFAIIHNVLYSSSNIFMDPSYAYFGLVFVMFGLFNVILFPMYYKTAYKYGAPVIISTVVAVLFAALVEVSVILNKDVAVFLEGSITRQLVILAVGILFFLVVNAVAYKMGVKRFEKVDV